MSDEVKKTIEGTNVKSAIDIAAKEFGVSAAQIKHKLDMSHFRSESGSMVSRDTVKIIAWVSDEKEAPPKPAQKAPVKEVMVEEEVVEDSTDEPATETKTEVEPAAVEPEEEGVETEASKIAVTWFEAVLPMMGITGSVKATGTEDRIRLIVSADPAGRLIGRRGATLDAIRHILRRILEDKGDFVIDVDIPDSRSRRSNNDRDGERGRGRGRGRDGGRDGGRGRGRGRDGGRGRGRGRGRGDDGDRHAPEKLQRLAKMAAEKAIESGKNITIQLEMNGYDRRIVHVEVADIVGVVSESVVKDGVKYVQIQPVSE